MAEGVRPLRTRREWLELAQTELEKSENPVGHKLKMYHVARAQVYATIAIAVMQ